MIGGGNNGGVGGGGVGNRLLVCGWRVGVCWLMVVVTVVVVDAAAVVVVVVAPVAERANCGIICLLHVMCVQHVT